jgi:uncharacterized iron-regulated membrane protein
VLTPADRRRSLYVFHSTLGVAIGVWLFTVAFTGAVSLFRAELDTWAQPGFAGDPSAPRGSADRVFATVSDALAGSTSVMMRFPDHASAAWDIIAVAPGRAPQRLRVDPTGAQPLGSARHEAATAYFRLHAYMLLPGRVGRYLVGLLGLVVVGTVLSGVFMHRNVWRQARELRAGRRLRIVAADLHRALGIWALLFHLLMGTTGAYLGLKDLLVAPALLARFDGDLAGGRAALAASRPRLTGTAAPLPELEPLIAAARRAIPGLEPNAVRLDHPGDTSVQVTVLGTLPGHLLPAHEAEVVEFAGLSGELLDVRDGARSAPPLRIYWSLAPLHFAAWGGPAVRLLYCVLGLCTALLAASGAVIFHERRLGRSARPRSAAALGSGGSHTEIRVADRRTA